MAHPLLSHDGHTLVNGLFWPCNDDVSFHDVPNGRCGRRLALEDNIPRIVPFGDDANESYGGETWPHPARYPHTMELLMRCGSFSLKRPCRAFPIKRANCA